MSDPRDSDLDDDTLPPDRRYQWRLSNDMTGDDWDMLNAEHERTGEYGALLDEKIDLEFRLHEIKEKLGMVPPTPPKPTPAAPKPTQTAPRPQPAQTPKAAPTPPPAAKASTVTTVPPKPAQAPQTDTPVVSRRAAAEARMTEKASNSSRVLVTAAPPPSDVPPPDAPDIEAEVEAHPS